MKKEKYTEEEIEYRISRTIPIWEEYINDSAHVIQHVIINNTTFEDLKAQIDRVIGKYN